MLEQQLPDVVALHPELVAHHYTEANGVEHALPYWQQAGQKAMQSSAYADAISHLTKGLDLLLPLPETRVRDQQELGLQIAFGAALIDTKGYAAPEVQPPFTRARELCDRLGETPQLSPVLRGLQMFYLVKAAFRPALELGEQLLRIAEHQQDASLLVGAHAMLGPTCYFVGEIRRAEKHLLSPA